MCISLTTLRQAAGKQKKKWSKGKVKDKANHAVVLDKATSERLNKDVQSYRLITVAILVDRMKVNGSVARQALHDLEERGVIKKVVSHARCAIYSTSLLSSWVAYGQKLILTTARAVGEAAA